MKDEAKGVSPARSPARYVLGLSAFYHDSAACLVADGHIAAAAEEERFTRRKHDPTFPLQAIRYCLSAAGIAPGDLAAVAFYEKPFIKFDRLLASHLAEAPRGWRSFLSAMPRWLRRNLQVKQILKRELGFDGPVYFPEHHEAHAASAFFASPFEEAAVLTLDGVGEWATTSLGVGKGPRVDLLAELHFPHSLGLLYSAFTAYCGFKVNSGEYKLMGLAPYGKPLYKQIIYDRLLDARPDGSFRLHSGFLQLTEGSRITGPRFDALFGGPARLPESPLDARFMDVARSIQEVLEERVLALAHQAHRETGLNQLCMAGGVALNCVANGRLLREGPFKQIWIQPASGDSGGALGAALFAWHQILGMDRNPQANQDAMQGACLGPEYSPAEIQAFLDTEAIPYRHLDATALIEQAAQAMAAQRIIGWFQGRMEFGPRALGHRSILADPRQAVMKDRINATIKQREGFRPFGCSVLRDHLSEAYGIDCDSPYMLMVAPALRPSPEAPYPYPAVTHVDGSARLQTVSAEAGHFHDLMQRFHALTGCPVLLNTSFNLRSEPLVCSPQEAYACFRRSGCDDLFLGTFHLRQEDMPAWHETSAPLSEAEWD